MSGPLQRRVGPIARGHHVRVRVQFVRPEDRARSRQGHRVAPPGASLRRDQVVPAVTLVDMRRLGEADCRAGEYQVPFTDELLSRRRVLLQDDAAEPVLSRPVIPQHVEEVLPPVVIMEQRRVEAAAVQVHRVGPVAVDGIAGDDVVVKVAERGAGGPRLRRAAIALHVGVDEIERSVRVRQARRPDAAGVGIAAHVELARAAERAREQAPVHEIAGVVNLDARIPLEGRGRDVVVVADTDDRGIGIEASKDRVADGRRGH